MTTVEDPTVDELLEVAESRTSIEEDLVTVLSLVYDVIDDFSQAEHAALGRLARAAGMEAPRVDE